MSPYSAVLPKCFKLAVSPNVTKLEGGIHYNLTRRADRLWYFSLLRPATRPLPQAEQARLNMLTEYYERQLEAMRQKLLAAGVDTHVQVDPVA